MANYTVEDAAGNDAATIDVEQVSGWATVLVPGADPWAVHVTEAVQRIDDMGGTVIGWPPDPE